MVNQKINLDKNMVGIAAVAIVLLAGAMFFGFIGFKVVLGIALFFFIPTYMVLRVTDLDDDEKLILSILLGVGVFSFLVYAADHLVKSLTSSVIIVFILLSGVGYMLYKIKEKKKVKK